MRKRAKKLGGTAASPSAATPPYALGAGGGYPAGYPAADSAYYGSSPQMQWQQMQQMQQLQQLQQMQQMQQWQQPTYGYDPMHGQMPPTMPPYM